MTNNNKEITVEVTRSDLVYLRRVLDNTLPEVQAAVADGLIDESILIGLDEAIEIVEEYLS